MTAKDISFIIPVFNRPDEIKEREHYMKLGKDL